MEIFDCHVHIMSEETLQLTEEWKKHRARVGLPEMELHHIDKTADMWLDELDSNGISNAVFLAFHPNNEACLKFINHSDRFVGFTAVNPTESGAAAKLEKDLKAGFKGVKLYPVSRKFHVDDHRANKVYDVCRKYRAPVMIHFGISLGLGTDMRYGNPIDLHSVAKEFADVNFIIPHFGAGMMRECLFLSYHCDNVYFDSSGSNSWMRYLPYSLTLRKVFRKFIDVAGIDRLLFGTDSSFFPRGYRKDILGAQAHVLRKLAISKRDQEKFFSGNIRRLLRL
jgi:predicted TIM-barrel fold metal-dependent hydrolase